MSIALVQNKGISERSFWSKVLFYLLEVLLTGSRKGLLMIVIAIGILMIVKTHGKFIVNTIKIMVIIGVLYITIIVRVIFYWEYEDCIEQQEENYGINI